ncbi:DUF4097 family beta strand repeat-containing protein [Streptomyces albidus (ex Kaewkla and Franco 2022)]|uniref:DUF4097 family beta strand repeat-containing protein n=1 Tax=Streptomyces albidus (ex Kaewkla and Franco 2022) TaxID=722709 RepID=UPI0015EFA8B3|nr:DUF4097 family beta strand repeat-containing protein [Streptomyces albidus (ex Kaewkla and Franco 2022)]
MGRHLRLLGAVAAAGIGVGALGACGIVPGETFEDGTKLSEKITSVRLDNRSGGVTLRGKETLTKVSLHRRVEFDGDRPKGPTHRVENGVLVLEGCGKGCSVRYTVDLPRRIPVTGKVTAGGVDLSGMGKVDVTTSTGAVDLDDIEGSVDVRTTNGRINGHGLKGDRVTARTSNGAIELAPATPQDVDAKTSNGAISITAPDSSYKVSARTSNGSKKIGVRNDPSGDHELDLATTNGAITVKSV